MKFGERSLLKFCREVNFDFTRMVDAGFRNFMTNYFDFDNLSDFSMVFLSEGQKSLFRFQYAILKIHKDFLKSGTEVVKNKTLLQALEERCREQTRTGELLERAFKYSLKSAVKYNYSTQKADDLSMDIREAHQQAKLVNYLPQTSFKSAIISYD